MRNFFSISVPSLGILLAASVLTFSCKKEKNDSNQTDPDPKEVVLVEEKFDAGSTFLGEFNNPIAKAKLENGRYAFSVIGPGTGDYSTWAGETPFAESDKRQSVEIAVRQDVGAVKDDVGLVFNLTDNKNYQTFNISADGYFTIFKKTAGKSLRLFDWKKSPEIKTALKTENKLKIILEGGKLKFQINGKEVHSLDAGDTKVLHQVGLNAYKSEVDPVAVTTYSVDYFKLSK